MKPRIKGPFDFGTNLGCRICEHPQYLISMTNNGHVGGTNYDEWAIYHECFGCGIHFGDPKKFAVTITQKPAEE